MMKVDAFIPLKGHSARVPGKNLRDFEGRPLFHVIVETLESAERIDRIFIDTDVDEIADSASSRGGVTVLRRDPALVGDDVSVNLLIESFLDRSEARHVLQTHATNPLLRPSTIDLAVDRYFADDAVTSVFAVTRYQARFYTADMKPVNHDPTELIPTQMLSPLYMENSNFYIFDADAFRQGGRRITDASAIWEMDPVEAIDIDEERDFALALTLARAGVESRRGTTLS